MLEAIKHFSEIQPSAIALVNSKQSLSYLELKIAIENLAQQLRDNHVSRVGLLMDNHPAWAVVDLACQLSKVTLIPIPIFFTPEQMSHAIDDAELDHFLMDWNSSQPLLARMSDITELAVVAGCPLYLSALNNTQSPLSGIDKITYTSGTTGQPKGVCLGINEMSCVASAIAQAIGVAKDERHLCLLPLAVLLENIGGLYVPLLAGGQAIIPSLAESGLLGAAGIDEMSLYQTICNYQPTSMILLPQMLQILIELSETGYSLPDSLRFIAVGGAPVSKSLLKRAEQQNIPLYEGYGLSECSSVVALNTPSQSRLGSVGKPLPHIQVRFAADGEIELRGNLFKGYLNQQAQSESWYASGDLGYLDDDGFLYLTGRKKNVFITAYARNVAPEWVERELTIQPEIHQAVVFGEARPFNVALIVARGEQSDAQIQLAVECANQSLPDYAQITEWLRASEPFTIVNHQYTATGRPRRDAIWQTYHHNIESYYQTEGNQPKEIS